MSNRMKICIILCIAAVFLFVSFFIQYHKAKAISEEVMSRNAYFALMPLVELYTESGPVNEKARDMHTEIFDIYTKSINDYKVTFPLSLFTDHPETDVTKMKEIPEKITNCANKGVYQQAIHKYYDELKEYLKYDYTLVREKDVPAEVQRNVLNKLQESDIYTLAFISGIDTSTSDHSKIKKSFRDASAICLASRMAIANAFLASATYENFFDSKEPLIRFRDNLGRVVYYNTVLRDSLPVKGTTDVETAKYNHYRDKLDKYSHSESRRRDIVQALIKDDIQEAQELLLTAMEKAISSY